jgi:hypothetical protein
MDGASHFQVSALAKGTALWCSAAYFNVPAIAWSGQRGCSPPLKGNGGVPQLVPASRRRLLTVYFAAGIQVVLALS